MFISRMINEKRRWWRYKARKEQLTGDYRTAIDALERYLLLLGAIVKGDILISMLEDLADLFEQSAATGTPIRAVVGEDPVAFADEFLTNYSQAQWINKERERLTTAIDRVAGEVQ